MGRKPKYRRSVWNHHHHWHPYPHRLRHHPHVGKRWPVRTGYDPVIAWLDSKETGKCSFCRQKSVTHVCLVEFCPVHRRAFIDGTMGSGACIDVEEHKLVADLMELARKYRGKLQFEILYPEERKLPAQGLGHKTRLRRARK